MCLVKMVNIALKLKNKYDWALSTGRLENTQKKNHEQEFSETLYNFTLIFLPKIDLHCI